MSWYSALVRFAEYEQKAAGTTTPYGVLPTATARGKPSSGEDGNAFRYYAPGSWRALLHKEARDTHLAVPCGGT